MMKRRMKGDKWMAGEFMMKLKRKRKGKRED